MYNRRHRHKSAASASSPSFGRRKTNTISTTTIRRKWTSYHGQTAVRSVMFTARFELFNSIQWPHIP
uniref:Uncharacterized protein n=1 Tax=Panagrellus redivivus TaxID=6233 RepID=A0A7E4VBR5_PANRE